MRCCLWGMTGLSHTSNRSNHGHLNKSKPVRILPFGWEGSTKATPLAEELLEAPGKGESFFFRGSW